MTAYSWVSAVSLIVETPTHLINVAKNRLLHAVVLDDFAKHTTVAAANHEYFLRIGMGVHGEMGDHLLVSILISDALCSPIHLYSVRKLIPFGALDDIVQD